jgi:dTDP-L-rhamnose 4-epimerase
LFNVYGSRQSMGNPYTGVINTFVVRQMNRRPAEVYEDGMESRDFVHVSDVVQAGLKAMDTDQADGQVLNVGTGRAMPMLQVARAVAAELGGPAPVVSAKYRVGDVRHCFADISRSRIALGYEPRVPFREGLRELLEHISCRSWADQSGLAERELRDRGLSS